MNWFSILKETKLVSSQRIRTKLGTTPLTMGDEEDDEDCCQQMKDFFIANMDNLDTEIYNNYNKNWDFVLDVDCENFIEYVKANSDGMRTIDDYSRKMKEVFGDSLLTYKWCNERKEN